MSDASKFVIEIDLGNDAMQTANHVVNAISQSVLKQASSMFDPLNQHEAGAIRDVHGNTVGTWRVD